MRTETPRTVYLKDYHPYPYTLSHVDLTFALAEDHTLVTSLMKFSKGADKHAALFLNGEDLDLIRIAVDGAAASDYTLTDKGLLLSAPATDSFVLEIVTRIKPQENTRLEGLYKSGDTFCTQCEAEGFRRITYFPDRPDVMATYTTRIEADKAAYPVLLSNGNLVETGESGKRHYAVWNDPFPKPCYLFALVAGKLSHIHDRFKTRSGRMVDLYIYVRPGDEDQCGHAMESLKKSMKWDEDVYGLEYDLDIFNIVAVSDFNMGAMENKSLNIFNTALVLAHQETATDADFMRVESVIAHEYFHNWSGNRVTCRDWFQLSLKEGLTVFRDQEFSADLHSRAVQRIDDVQQLRRLQFPEDSSPLAHPIRPDNYIEINNFYTTTVYEKGAEVIRMIRTILGDDLYRKGTDLYFSRHDGQAATCDDFLQCMEDASGYDLSHFKLWYSQAGTPEIEFTSYYDEHAKTYTATFIQKIPDTAGQESKKPMHIPIAIGLIGPDGEECDLGGGTTTKVLHLTQSKQSYVFENIQAKPTPSVLRNFSAPVKLKSELSNRDLSFLMLHDTDGFNRWEAGQQLSLRMLNTLTDQVESAEDLQICPRYLDVMSGLVSRAAEDTKDPAFFARALTLPNISIVVQGRQNADPEAIYKGFKALQVAIKRSNKEPLEALYEACRDDKGFDITPASMGRRALRNTALLYLTANYGENCIKRAYTHYRQATNMTDRVASLSVLAHTDTDEAAECFSDFYTRFRSYPLVVDKWFSIQASATRDDILDVLHRLRSHEDFNMRNPNRVRSVFGAFAMSNTAAFHRADGKGYEFLTDGILELNGINPQIAARLLTPMREWKAFTSERQNKMRACLEKILEAPDLSPDVYEIASKSLKG